MCSPTSNSTHQVEWSLLEEALRTGVDSSNGMDVVALTLRRLRSLLPWSLRRKEGHQEEGQDERGKEEEEAP